LKVELDWLKKHLIFSVKEKKGLIDPEHERLSIAGQAMDEADGAGSGLPKTSVESERGSASKVSVSAQRPGH
jgi:hypothetical protein